MIFNNILLFFIPDISILVCFYLVRISPVIKNQPIFICSVSLRPDDRSSTIPIPVRVQILRHRSNLQNLNPMLRHAIPNRAYILFSDHKRDTAAFTRTSGGWGNDCPNPQLFQFVIKTHPVIVIRKQHIMLYLLHNSLP